MKFWISEPLFRQLDLKGLNCFYYLMKNADDEIYLQAQKAWKGKTGKGLRIKCMLECNNNLKKAEKMFFREYVDRQKSSRIEIEDIKEAKLQQWERSLSDKEHHLQEKEKKLKSTEMGLATREKELARKSSELRRKENEINKLNKESESFLADVLKSQKSKMKREARETEGSEIFNNWIKRQTK